MKGIVKLSYRIDIFLIIMLLVIISGYAVINLVSTDGGNTPVKLSIIVEESGNERWISFLEGAEQSAEQNNVELSVVPSTGFTDFSEEAALVEEEFQDGADGLLISLIDSDVGKELLDSIQNHAGVVLMDSKPTGTGFNLQSAVQPDADKMAEMLLGGIEKDLGEDLTGKSVVIFAGNQKQENCVKLLSALEEGILSRNGRILWKIASPYNVKWMMKYRQTADMVLALEDKSLSEAAKYLMKKQSTGVKLYGIGNSSENVYYLEHGVISGMAVVDYFTMGYVGVEHAVHKTTDEFIVPVRYVRPDEVYDVDNEYFLFP